MVSGVSGVFQAVKTMMNQKQQKKKVCFLHTGHEQRYNSSEVETAINNRS